VPNQINFEMMEALKLDLPRNKMTKAHRDTVYKIDAESTLIVARRGTTTITPKLDSLQLLIFGFHGATA
jgi:hypothetical protein